LLILTGQRKNQVAGLQWSEIDFGEAERRQHSNAQSAGGAPRPAGPVGLRSSARATRWTKEVKPAKGTEDRPRLLRNSLASCPPSTLNFAHA
jgi:hypothetical protein